MQKTYFGVIAFLAIVANNSTAMAAPAHCWADVTISDGTRSTSANTNWDRRTNGKKWLQTLGNHRSECDDLGANYFASLDLVALAKANGMCGKITASGSSWIGTSPKRGTLGPRTVDVPCEATTNGEETKSDYQYASKLICGKVDGGLAIPGQYRGVVNIHNPNYDKVDFRYKFAEADPARDGKISYFTDSTIGPDGAQRFDCEYIQKIANLPDPVDGFFVVESREPLDVVTYYTGGDEKQVSTLDVESTRERKIEDGRQWSCGRQRVDLAQATGWTVNGVPASRVLTARGAPMTSFTPYNHTGMSVWLADTPNINDQQPAGNFDYRLQFCICSDGQEYLSAAAINIAALRADNSVTANIDGTSTFINGPNVYNNPVAGSGSVNVAGAGDHFLEFRAVNGGGPHAVGFSGSMTVENGYLGACRPD